MKIWTRIGVLRMTSTYTAVNWLTTGMRWARAAPSTSPIANEPGDRDRRDLDRVDEARRTARASSRRRTPRGRRSRRMHQAHDGGGRAAAAASPHHELRAHGVHARRRRGRVRERVRSGRRMFFENDVHEPRRDVGLRGSAGTGPSCFIRSRRESTHAFSCGVALLDADAERRLEERVVGQLRGAVGRRDRRAAPRRRT